MEDDFLFDLDNSNAIEQETQSFDDLFDSNATQSNSAQNAPVDYITATLNSKGINRNSVKFEDDNGDIVEKRFDDLTDQEKYNILNTKTSDPVLSDQEIDIVNYMRENGFNSLAEMEEYHRNQALNEINNRNFDSYTIDDLTDEELLRFDLKEKYPDLTEHELDELMVNETSNPEIFAKKVNSLRQEYMALEEEERQAEQNAATMQYQNDFASVANDLADVARNTDEIFGFQLEDSEKEDLLSFLLDTDANGKSEFVKAFDNPEVVYATAWFMKHGGDAINTLNNYWKGQLAQARKGNNVYRKQPNNTKSTDPDLDKYFK